MNWTAVRSALSDPRWDFRTVRGIVKDTGLSEGLVRQLLDEHRSEVRQTVSRDRRRVYTLNSRPRKIREVVPDLRQFTSKSL